MERVSFFKKNDIIILIVLLSVAAAGLFVFHLAHSGDGKKVRVTVDGELFGEYDLGAKDNEDDFPEVDAVAGGQGTGRPDTVKSDPYNGKDNAQRIESPGKVGKCILIICDGKADMESADCPNQICVHHSSISHKGETIICLPNRVVIEIVD